jgi:hypothetical protein
MQLSLPKPLDECPVLAKASAKGKQKIQGKHRARFPNTIQRSVDFEGAAMDWQSDPSLARWDYLLLSTHKGWAAVEVHQARASDLQRKKIGTQTILRQHCHAMLIAIKSWQVCVEGEIHPTQRRQLADAQIHISRHFLDKP